MPTKSKPRPKCPTCHRTFPPPRKLTDDQRAKLIERAAALETQLNDKQGTLAEIQLRLEEDQKASKIDAEKQGVLPGTEPVAAPVVPPPAETPAPTLP